MKERFEKMLWYIVWTVAIFYITPIVCALIQFPLFNILPAIYMCVVMVVSFMFAKKHGGDWLISIAMMVVFIPCIEMFFNPTVWIYVPIYGVMSFIGMIIGTVFKNRFLK